MVGELDSGKGIPRLCQTLAKACRRRLLLDLSRARDFLLLFSLVLHPNRAGPRTGYVNLGATDNGGVLVSYATWRFIEVPFIDSAMRNVARASNDFFAAGKARYGLEIVDLIDVQSPPRGRQP